METMVESNIKKIKYLAKKFIISGILIAVFLFAVDMLRVAILRGHDFDEDGESGSVCESLKNTEFELPYHYYNLLSAKEGVLTELIRKIDDEEIDINTFHPYYKYLDDNHIILNDGINDKLGITDGKGHWVLAPEYYSIGSHYYEKLGILVLNHSSVIDRDGNYIVSGCSDIHVHDEIKGGRIVVEIRDQNRNSRYGVCDLSGNYILEPKYKKIEYGNNIGDGDLMYVVDEEDRNRVFDSTGKELIEGGYESISFVYCNNKIASGHYFIIQDVDGKWYTCDRYGKEYMSSRYDALYKCKFAENEILIAKKEGKEGIINALTDEVILDINYKHIKHAENGVFIVKTMDGEVGIYELNKGFVLEPSPSYSSIGIICDDSKAKQDDEQYHCAYMVTTKDSKNTIFTIEDGFFMEPQDIISRLGEAYEEGGYQYFSKNKVVVISYGDELQHRLVLKYGKEPLEIERASRISIFENYIWVYVGDNESYAINYDGERIE